MTKESAGVLVFRKGRGGVEVFLVHPGGPFWAKKDDGAWSIAKGLIDPGEEPQAAARREFAEETGVTLSGDMMALGAFKQPSRKVIHAFACAAEIDPDRVRSNRFEMEWPPKSGKRASFPEVDRAGWFSPREALLKVTKGQRAIVLALIAKLGLRTDG